MRSLVLAIGLLAWSSASFAYQEITCHEMETHGRGPTKKRQRKPDGVYILANLYFQSGKFVSRTSSIEIKNLYREGAPMGMRVTNLKVLREGPFSRIPFTEINFDDAISKGVGYQVYLNFAILNREFKDLGALFSVGDISSDSNSESVARFSSAAPLARFSLDCSGKLKN